MSEEELDRIIARHGIDYLQVELERRINGTNTTKSVEDENAELKAMNFEMLQALRSIVNINPLLIPMTESQIALMLNQILRIARAAIAKAEGRQV